MTKTRNNKLIMFMVSFMALMCIIMISGTKTDAATIKNYKYTTVAPDTWVNAKDYTYQYANSNFTYTYYYYKITVPNNSCYLKFSAKNSSDYLNVHFYNTKPTTSTNYKKYIRISASGSTGSSSYVILPKGTWYFAADYDCRIKYSVKSTNFGSDRYCISKAKTLSAGKTAVACQDSKHDNASWYKITLDANKKVTFWSNDRYGFGTNIKIYDKFRNRVQFEEVSSSKDLYKFATKAKLAKGTYYIRLSNDDVLYDSREYKWESGVTTFKWQ